MTENKITYGLTGLRIYTGVIFAAEISSIESFSNELEKLADKFGANIVYSKSDVHKLTLKKEGEYDGRQY